MHAELDMKCPADFGTLPDCDCPFQHWHIGGALTCLDVHFEEDASVHLRLYTGDYEAETILMGMSSLEQALPFAFRWAASLIGDEFP